MKKFIFPLLTILFTFQLVAAQKEELMLKKTDNGFFLEHKVGAKESFFSIGRLYNVHPRHLASFNKLDMTKGLLLNQVMRIPLSDTNFIQQGNSGTPVYYKTGDDEGLVKVSSRNNNVTLANLRNWNNLTKDKLKEGTKLIVGFLLSKEMPSITINNKPQPDEPVGKTKEKPVVVEPIVEEKPVVKTEEKPIVTVQKVEEKAVANLDQGYFKLSFDQQVKISPVSKNEMVTAGIFKTASGWQDAKYYLLIDKVSPGTIVKIINPTNNKAVFAKVLGEMSGIRQNDGLNIRISNAAASMLEITEPDKFIVKVTY